ncbi:hypothetical protein, partial [Bacteroides pyogenes]|uniref:hypothetical protein n=1 Tax=Bacteroides pyogenes TaxID=310300 RepID=UPI001BA4B967
IASQKNARKETFRYTQQNSHPKKLEKPSLYRTFASSKKTHIAPVQSECLSNDRHTSTPEVLHPIQIQTPIIQFD